MCACVRYHLVCNTPAILSFDPFPNYRPSTIETISRQKREIVEDDEQDEIDVGKVTKDDQIELDKLRQQVDEVLKKVRMILFRFLFNQFSSFKLVRIVRSTFNNRNTLLRSKYPKNPCKWNEMARSSMSCLSMQSMNNFPVLISIDSRLEILSGCNKFV